jgi:hypothetical protein
MLLRVVSVLSLFLLLPATAADKPAAPYTIAVWSDVSFNSEGGVSESRIVKEADYPVKFVDAVKAKTAAMRITPPAQDGKPGELRSGVRVSYLITPSASGASVSLQETLLAPLPLREVYVAFPKSLNREDSWKGRIDIRCGIDSQGQCQNPVMTTDNGSLPEDARRFAKDSISKWKFAPQTVNGQAIPGEFRMSIDIAPDPRQIEDFRDPRKL